MTPHQLVSELDWFPAESCIVLWGDADLCSSVLILLETVPNIPLIFKLKRTPGLWDLR
jgi:hypothetical protein